MNNFIIEAIKQKWTNMNELHYAMNENKKCREKLFSTIHTFPKTNEIE